MSADECDDAYGDAVYRAWRAGMNPDRVSRERVCESLAETGDAEVAASREVRRLRDLDEREATRPSLDPDDWRLRVRRDYRDPRGVYVSDE